jgi:glycerol dehydrogenase
MMQKAIFPGQYIQGSGVLKELPALIQSFGSKAILLASPTVNSVILPAHKPQDIEDLCTIEEFRGECCESELQRFSALIRDHKVDLVIGMGGGKVIDTAKITADWEGLPVIIIPTIASTDAPCSGCAVKYSAEGVFEEVLFQKHNPSVVLVDLNIIAASPVRFLVSGMGDALATWFEAHTCSQNHELNECGGHSTLAGIGIAKLCYDTLMEYGYQAIIANEERIVTPALANITEANILLSGIGFESCGIACAHAVHNGLTVLPQTHACYHGEKVAFGVLTGLHLNSAECEVLDEVYKFCEVSGLPTTLAELGVNYQDQEQIMSVAIATCVPESSIHKEAGEITPDLVYSAIMMADALGRKRKGQ